MCLQSNYKQSTYSNYNYEISNNCRNMYMQIKQLTYHIQLKMMDPLALMLLESLTSKSSLTLWQLLQLSLMEHHKWQPKKIFMN